MGISSCLLGAEVRYDGGHKHDRYLTDVVGKWFQWVLVCPELELGLGVPRPPIRLVHGGDNPRLVEHVSGDELTERMESYAREKVVQLQETGLDGFILKGASPSCGVEGVKVFGQDEEPSRNGVGVFAKSRLETASASLPACSSGSGPTFRWPRKDGSRIQVCAEISSSACSAVIESESGSNLISIRTG